MVAAGTGKIREDGDDVVMRSLRSAGRTGGEMMAVGVNDSPIFTNASTRKSGGEA